MSSFVAGSDPRVEARFKWFPPTPGMMRLLCVCVISEGVKYRRESFVVVTGGEIKSCVGDLQQGKG
jgi:hypothetical protein